MRSMFDNAEAFNQDISGWDVTNSTNMINMFKDAIAFNQDLSSWSVNPNVNNCTDFDTGASSWVLSRPAFTTCTI